MLNIILNLNIAIVIHTFQINIPNIFHGVGRILTAFIIFICSFTSALLISAVQQRTRLFNESAIQLTRGKARWQNKPFTEGSHYISAKQTFPDKSGFMADLSENMVARNWRTMAPECRKLRDMVLEESG